MQLLHKTTGTYVAIANVFATFIFIIMSLDIKMASTCDGSSSHNLRQKLQVY